MPCEHVKLPGGGTAIVCGPRPRRRKCSNGYCCRWAERECDFPVQGRKSGACDKPLCASCAVSIGPDLDYCPSHPREPEEVRRTIKQLDLFEAPP